MPITIRNVYDNAVSFEKLLKSHKKARRGKREKKRDNFIWVKFRKRIIKNYLKIL